LREGGNEGVIENAGLENAEPENAALLFGPPNSSPAFSSPAFSATGSLCRSCVKVREKFELRFGMVSGIVPRLVY